MKTSVPPPFSGGDFYVFGIDGGTSDPVKCAQRGSAIVLLAVEKCSHIRTVKQNGTLIAPQTKLQTRGIPNYIIFLHPTQTLIILKIEMIG